MTAATIRVWYPSDVGALLIDVALLTIWGASVGYAFHRMPARWLARDNVVTRPRRWERDGRFWQDMLRVRRWKDRVPDAGALFQGGRRKRTMTRNRDDLGRLAIETRRAEWVHLVVLVITPLFFLWNPLWLALVMVTYNVVANVPFIIIQRYNRPRLTRLLARRPASG